MSGVLVAGLATHDDDASIRTLLRSTPVPGMVTVSYEQEPSFTQGTEVLGPFVQTLVGRDAASGDVRALACRSIRRRFVNGEEVSVGYLSHLRIDGRMQGRWLLSRGFRALRDLDADQACTGYITTIVDGNMAAVGVLVDKPRPSIPAYYEYSRLQSLAIPVRRVRPETRGYSVSTASHVDIPQLLVGMTSFGRRRQFAPVWTADDFAPGSTTLRGLSIDDFVILRDSSDELVASGAVWDQGSFKQAVVRGYDRTLNRWRPAVNIAAAAVGHPGLPAVGERLRTGYAALIAVRDDDAAAYRTLLEHLRTRAAERGLGFLMVGHAEDDPLLPVARRFAHLTYRSTLYTVGWDDCFHDGLDERPAAVEVACL